MTSPAPSEGQSRRRVAGIALLGIGIIAAIIGLASLAFDGDDGGGDPIAAPPPSATATADPSAGATPTDGSVPPGGVAPTTGAPGPTPPSTSPTDGIAAPPGAPGAPAPGAPAPGAPAPGAPAPGAPGGDGAGTGGAGSGSGDGSDTGEGAGSGDGAGTAAGAGGGGGGGGDSKVSVVRLPVRVYNNSTISGLAARAAEDFRSAGWPVEEVANYPSGIIPTSTVYYRPGTNEKQAADTLGNEFTMRVEPRFEGLNDASAGIIVIVTNDYQRR